MPDLYSAPDPAAPSNVPPAWREVMGTALVVAAALFLPYVVAFVIGGITYGVIAGLSGVRGDGLRDAIAASLGPPAPGFWIASIFAVMLMILATQALARRRFGDAWRVALGLRSHAIPPSLAAFLLLLLLGYFLWAIGVVTTLQALWPSQAIMPEITKAVSKAGGTVPLAMVLLVLLAPISEELLFRGYAFARMATVLPRDMVIFVTAAGFALAHFNGGILHPLVTLYLGIATGWLRASHGSILPGIILHGGVNSLAVAAMLAA